MPLFLVWVSLPLVVITFLIVAVLEHPKGLFWDLPIMLGIHSLTGTQLDIFAARLTLLGIEAGVLPAAAVIGLILSVQKKWRQLQYLAITVLGTILLNYATKLIFHRSRPYLWDSFYPKPYDYAFPSGHAMYSMMFVVMLGVLAWKTPWYKVVLILGGLFVLAIAWTRIYLGVHYPSDILAGWMIGIAWAMLINLWIQPNQEQKKHSELTTSAKRN